jgi:hypothetical protein
MQSIIRTKIEKGKKDMLDHSIDSLSSVSGTMLITLYARAKETLSVDPSLKTTRPWKSSRSSKRDRRFQESHPSADRP